MVILNNLLRFRGGVVFVAFSFFLRSRTDAAALLPHCDQIAGRARKCVSRVSLLFSTKPLKR